VAGTTDYFLVKYSSEGTRIWVKQVGAATKTTHGRNLRVTNSGYIYLCGHTSGSLNGQTLAGVRDALVAKYDIDGNHIWTRQLGVAGFTAYGISGTIDNLENYYIVGYTDGGLDGNTLIGTRDAFVTKYDAFGTKQWTKQQGVAGVTTQATSVMEDSDGFIYVAGDSKGGLDGNTLQGVTDLTITKFDNLGQRLWTVQHGAATVTMSYPQIDIDTDGNMVIASYTNGSFDGQTIQGTQDISTLKFDSEGNHLWTRLIGGPGGIGNTTGIVVDQYNRIFVSGNTTVGLDGNELIGTLDSVILKYTPSGDLV
jgi:hypothetical protein